MREERALSWKAVFLVYGPAFVFGLGAIIGLPPIPTLARAFDVGLGTASFALTSFFIGSALGALPAGWLIDRFGRRRIMLAAVLATFLLVFATLSAHDFAELLAFRFLSGVAAQLWMMGQIVGFATSARSNQRGRLVVWMAMAQSTGAGVAMMVQGPASAAWGIRAAPAAYGVIVLLLLIPALRLVQDRPFDAGPVNGLPLRAALSPRIAGVSLLAFFGLVVIAPIALTPVAADLLNLYAAFHYILKASTIGTLTAFAAILSLPITFFAGWVMDRFGRKWTLLPGFGGVAVAMAAIAVTAGLHLSLAWWVVCFMFATGATALTAGAILTLGIDIAPRRAGGTFLGLWVLTVSLSRAIGPLEFALLSNKGGYTSSFLVAAAVALAATLLLVFRIPETLDAGDGPAEQHGDEVPAEAPS